MTGELSPRGALVSPFVVGGVTLRNRFVKSATYEGRVAEGLRTRALVRHHVELARGGVGMTTVAYCAVSPDGRTFANQIVMGERALPHLRVLTDAVHEAGARVMVQL